jgi:alpha-L-fucosidase
MTKPRKSPKISRAGVRDKAAAASLPPRGDTSWFVKDRFGMFIHWGLYAQGARHEWLMHREELSVGEYERRYFKRFDPDLYDPRLWARAAADAGMKYFVITAKHHEGFCLWNTRQTDYKAPNTAAGHDLLRPAVEAFREAGLRVGFYYSLLDWHHPDFVIDNRHGPYRNLCEEERARLNAGRDMSRYAAYMRAQVKELLTGYGPVDILWFDFSYPDRERPDDFTRGKGRLAWESENSIAWCASCVRARSWTTGSTCRAARTSRRRSSSSRASGLPWTASGWSGRPARPSAAHGATIVTRRAGAARRS